MDFSNSITANGIVNNGGNVGLCRNSITQFHGEPQYHEQATNNFWNSIEKGLFIKMPDYVKNLLTMVGFNNHVSVRRLTSEDILEMETFARDVAKDLFDRRVDPKKIYGIYSQQPDHFKILPGHKRLIEAIRDYVASLPNEHFAANNKRNLTNITTNNSNNIRQQVEAQNGCGASNNNENNLKQNTPIYSIDLQEEKRQLERLIYQWITCNCPPILNGQDVEVSVCAEKETNEILSATPTRGLTGSVKCPLCFAQVKVGTSPTKSSKRWIISNFVRHARGHYAKDNAEENNLGPHRTDNTEQIVVWPEFNNLISTEDSNPATAGTIVIKEEGKRIANNNQGDSEINIKRAKN